MLQLAVVDGMLAEIPSDEYGPLVVDFSQGKSWCATITFDRKPILKEMNRHFWSRPKPKRYSRYYVVPAHLDNGTVVEFGVNENPPTEADEIVATEEPQRRKRRWYGVITGLILNDDKDTLEALEFEEFDSVEEAWKASPGLSGRHVNRAVLAEFVQSVRNGDTMAALFLSDWLSEQGDRRGQLLRKGLVDLVNDLIIECPREEVEDAR